jgi:hypothetical protein
MTMAQHGEAADSDDEELVQRIIGLRRGVEEGTIALWTGDEALPAYLDRARSLRR